jgi:hypothetical protein
MAMDVVATSVANLAVRTSPKSEALASGQ